MEVSREKQETFEKMCPLMPCLLLGQWILCEQIFKFEVIINFTNENILS